MTFTSTHLFETEEQEAARLAQAPVGSTNHALASLPITIHEYVQDMVIQLPWTHSTKEDAYVMVVVPIEHHPTPDYRKTPIRLHDGWWTCAVVYSTHLAYSVGGHRICVSDSELIRGRRLNIHHVTYEAGS